MASKTTSSTNETLLTFALNLRKHVHYTLKQDNYARLISDVEANPFRITYMMRSDILVESLSWDTDEDQQKQRLPSSVLTDRPIINPSRGRVSVAAGMVVTPDELESTIGSGKYKTFSPSDIIP
ncbi:uncharacterized protein EV154DRAFT_574852 [Mucor mucedo]|uniref:uncharacterized protein n=1 Tax=Mucor mucedo TaxID=29922 RepID=UPI0022206078|nr:uncharacterized protein EV154DRAFT_574852 [Mucor mucedo]KAI7883856.1 hypothetical protein EV154DRAFT_574852 [Mucor mucedo]